MVDPRDVVVITRARLQEVVDGAVARGRMSRADAAELLDELITVPRDLAPSTWGHAKDFTTWDSPAVAEMAFAARAAELRTVAAVAGHGTPHSALERAARELLAMQASDWSFMVTRDLAADYPAERLGEHSAALDAAMAALTDSAVAPEPSLRTARL